MSFCLLIFPKVVFHKSGIILIEANYYDGMEAPSAISWVCTSMLRYPTLLVNLQRKISVLVWLTHNMIFSQWFGTPLRCYDRSLAVWKRSYIMIIVPCFHQVSRVQRWTWVELGPWFKHGKKSLVSSFQLRWSGSLWGCAKLCECWTSDISRPGWGFFPRSIFSWL